MTTTVCSNDNDRLVRHYGELYQRYGDDVRSVDWGSRESQEKRFAALVEVGPLQGASILDIGCGLGDLPAYLKQRGITARYTGYDVTPRMIKHCRSRFPDQTFLQGDPLGDPVSHPSAGQPADPLEWPLDDQSFDYVIASGIFSVHRRQPAAYLYHAIQQMYRLCRIGVAFNTLSTCATTQVPGEFHADPSDVLERCLGICPRVTLRHDYLPQDFTVYMYKRS